MADSMIERVARKRCEQEGCDPDATVVGEGAAAGRTWLRWQAYASQARELIAVMREPTDEMCDAGEMTSIGECDHMFAGKVFTAMIDEALEEAGR